MSWHDRAQQGSFRGVPFHVNSNEMDFGPRTIVHEYPKQDKAYIEPNGKKPREIPLEFFVVGEDYDRERDALIAALEEAGPGELVVPKLGRMTVNVTRAHMRETKEEGGKASFSVTFLEAGELQFPKAAVNTKNDVVTKAGTARTALQTAFAKVFKVLRKPSYIAEQADTLIRSATDQLRVINGGIAALTEPYASLARDIDQFGDELATLMQQPANLVSDFTGLMGSVHNAVADVQSAIDVYDNLFDFGDDLSAVSVTTSNRQIEADNQAAIVQMVRAAAVIEHAVAETNKVYAIPGSQSQPEDAVVVSLDEAQAIRDTLAGRLQTLAFAATDDDLYATLMALRAAVVKDINTRAVNLPRVIRYTPPATLPMVVIAHRLYGDARRADELIARNKIRNPLFVSGGVTLEALEDVTA